MKNPPKPPKSPKSSTPISTSKKSLKSQKPAKPAKSAKPSKSCKSEISEKPCKPQKPANPGKKIEKPSPAPPIPVKIEKKPVPIPTISSSEELSDISDDSSDQIEYNICQSSYKSQFNYSNPLSLLQSDINTCFICNLSLSSKYELDSHLYFHQAIHIFKCMICGKSFKFKRQLRRHCRDSHLDEELKRFSKRKSDKWLRTYFKSSETEERLYLAGLEKPNMEFFCSLATSAPILEEIQMEWASNEFYDDHIYNYEEFYLVED